MQLLELIYYLKYDFLTSVNCSHLVNEPLLPELVNEEIFEGMMKELYDLLSLILQLSHYLGASFFSELHQIFISVPTLLPLL